MNRTPQFPEVAAVVEFPVSAPTVSLDLDSLKHGMDSSYSSPFEWDDFDTGSLDD